jgi:hypothetical protein
MISTSLPEPLCDVYAQIGALTDKNHPKDAAWFARGTRCPGLISGAERLALDGGMLFTTVPEKAMFLWADPSDAGLAVILGYVEPKCQIRGWPIVVRAMNDGCVVTEMMCSICNVERAALVLKSHGDVSVTTLSDALSRRVELLRLER